LQIRLQKKLSAKLFITFTVSFIRCLVNKNQQNLTFFISFSAAWTGMLSNQSKKVHHSPLSAVMHL